MNALLRRALTRASRARLLRPFRRNPGPYEAADVAHQAASDVIKKRLMGTEPVMIARFGSIELGCLATYAAMHRDASMFRKTLDFVRGKRPAPWWQDGQLHAMTRNAGFFPSDAASIERFCVEAIEY